MECIIIRNNIIIDKSFTFAIDIVNLYKYLVDNKKEYVISKQILRSGTSIGANIKEAINGISKADFRFKMNIALKEANETEYWIELLTKSKILSENRTSFLLDKCKELCKLLNSIVKKQLIQCTIVNY